MPQKPSYIGRPPMCNSVVGIVQLWTIWFTGTCTLHGQRMSESQHTFHKRHSVKQPRRSAHMILLPKAIASGLRATQSRSLSLPPEH